MSAELQGLHVLIVDDESDLRQALAFDFRRRGCQVFEASSGRTAIEVVRLHRIDVVLSDVRMPNGSGVDLLKEIREIDPDLPIVLLATGFADLTEAEALELGAYALLEKPIDRKRMVALFLEAAAKVPRAV